MQAQFIQTTNKLKAKVGVSSAADDLIAMQSIDKAIAGLEPEFSGMIEHQVHSLRSFSIPYSAKAITEIFEISHAIRGLAGSFGRPELSGISDSLCRYLSTIKEKSIETDQRLIFAHLQAIFKFGPAKEGEATEASAVIEALQRAVSQKSKNIENPDLETKR